MYCLIFRLILFLPGPIQLKMLRSIFSCLLLCMLLVSTTSYKVTPELNFKVMVINRSSLDAVFKSADKIVFQHTNAKGDQGADGRHKFKLIAYFLQSGKYVKVPNNFFDHTTDQ